MMDVKSSPYIRLMRLHQRTGIWLLLWPCWWSIALASDNLLRDLPLFIVFLVGAVVMRSAGCVVNDIWDRKIDAQVARTKNRPLASGELQLNKAILSLVMLLIIGLAVASMLNRFTLLLGVGFTLMVIAYPLMKRWIRIPQLFLGLTINAGALMGWSAVTGSLAPEALLLYAACFFWTLGYDTIYAHQDKYDDAKIGVKSSALAFGERTKAHVYLYYTFMIGFLGAIGPLSNQSWDYYIQLGVAFVHLLWQVRSVKLDDPVDCMRIFRANGSFGWIVFLGIIFAEVIEGVLP